LTTRDNALVEATFGSMNTLLCQHVAAYTGSNTTLRGLDATGAWTLPELQDLLDEWLLAGWQPRPHDGLRDPLLPRRALSPNEMYAALVAAAGYLPLTLSVRIAAGDTILTDTPTSRIGLDAALPCEGCRGGYRPITKCVPEPKEQTAA